MRVIHFFPGEKVYILTNRDGLIRGSSGVIKQRWFGETYAVRAASGDIVLLTSNELQSLNPSVDQIKAGDIVKVGPNVHTEPHGVNPGERVQVLRIFDRTNYYEVLIDNNLRWLAEYELAPYVNLLPP